MQPLEQVLNEHELIVLRVIGEWWEQDLMTADKSACVSNIVETFASLNLADEISRMLPEEAEAMRALIADDGRLPVATFVRNHGEVRLMGPGKLEQDEPWFDPVSAAEALWYRGLIYRGFEKTADGVLEFYFIPNELMETAPNAEDVQIGTTSGNTFGLTQSIDDAPPVDVPDDVAAFLAKAQKKKGQRPEAKGQSVVAKKKGKGSGQLSVDGGKKSKMKKEKAESNPKSPISNLQSPKKSQPPAKKAPAPKSPNPPISQPPAQSAPSPAPSPQPPAPRSLLTPLPPPRDPQSADSYAVDDIATMLSLAQNRPLTQGDMAAVRPYLLNKQPEYANLLLAIAVEMGALKKGNSGIKPTKSAVSWLKQSRAQQTEAIAKAWRTCVWNELRNMPSVICEGSNWQNEPKSAREALLAVLPHEDAWFSFDELTATIKKQNPDFQRPAGDYDTWYIRDTDSGDYLRGFENWDGVEGRLLRFMLAEPMRWLGLSVVDGNSFRLTKSAVNWLRNIPADSQEEVAEITVQAGAQILVPQNADRYQRFSVARIAEQSPIVANQPFIYRVTPKSLLRAKEQKITPQQVLQFLQKSSGQPLPTSTKRAIERWGEKAVEAKLQPATILRVRDGNILNVLRNNEKTKPFIGEALGEFAAVVKEGEWENLRHAAAELGLLLDESVTSS